MISHPFLISCCRHPRKPTRPKTAKQFRSTENSVICIVLWKGVKRWGILWGFFYFILLMRKKAQMFKRERGRQGMKMKDSVNTTIMLLKKNFCKNFLGSFIHPLVLFSIPTVSRFLLSGILAFILATSPEGLICFWCKTNPPSTDLRSSPLP